MYNPAFTGYFGEENFMQKDPYCKVQAQVKNQPSDLYSNKCATSSSQNPNS